MGLTDTFRALADPTRREILRLLAAGDLTAGEIARRFAMTRPSVSHHLAVLRKAALVRDRRRGQHVVYSLEATVFQEALAWGLDLVQRREGGREGR
jgi:ArsR family transcriptional regulator